MKKLTCIIAVIFCAMGSYGQSNCDCFDRLYSLSAHYDAIDSVQKSVEIMKDAITFLEPNRRYDYYYSVGDSYAYLNQFDSAVKYYRLAVSEGGYPLASVKEKYPGVYYKLDTNTLRNRLKKHTAEIDLVLFSRFSNTLLLDQAVRGFLVTEREFLDTNAQKRELLNILFDRTDSNTFEFVRYVLERYKFPTFQRLHFYPNGFMGMILHMAAYNNEWSEYLYSRLAELNTQCEFPQKSQILFLRERYARRNGGITKAGVMVGDNRFMNVADITKADSIRLQHNMLRIQEERRPGEEVSKNYVPMPYPKNYFCLKKYNGVFK